MLDFDDLEEVAQERLAQGDELDEAAKAAVFAEKDRKTRWAERDRELKEQDKSGKDTLKPRAPLWDRPRPAREEKPKDTPLAGNARTNFEPGVFAGRKVISSEAREGQPVLWAAKPRAPVTGKPAVSAPKEEEEFEDDDDDDDDGEEEDKADNSADAGPKKAVKGVEAHAWGSAPGEVHFQIFEKVLPMQLGREGVLPYEVVEIWENQWKVLGTRQLKFVAPKGMDKKWLTPREDPIPSSPEVIRLEGKGAILYALELALTQHDKRLQKKATAAAKEREARPDREAHAPPPEFMPRDGRIPGYLETIPVPQNKKTLPLVVS